MTQKNLILSLLKENGNKGLNSYDADYTHHVKQAPTRIHELKQDGHLIVARNNPDKSVNWILLSPITQQHDAVVSKPISAYHYVPTTPGSYARHEGILKLCQECGAKQMEAFL